MVTNRFELYPEIEPYSQGELAVGNSHVIHFEECGNPKGKPALFLHGGPGAGKAPFFRRLFDPASYRLILFDQRGCGQSRPHASVDNNTTAHLLADIEALRAHLNINRWLVFGGSWGSTLALLYAQANPQIVSEMILYGIFLGTKEEISWFYQHGANQLLPEAWTEFCEPIDPDERNDMMSAYHRRLFSEDPLVSLTAAKAWAKWEARALRLMEDTILIKAFAEDKSALSQARLECHYFLNECFLASNQIINAMPSINHIPAMLVHGRYDLICPVRYAWLLHKKWDASRLAIIPDAGHSAREPGISASLIAATNSFAST